MMKRTRCRRGILRFAAFAFAVAAAATAAATSGYLFCDAFAPSPSLRSSQRRSQQLRLFDPAFAADASVSAGASMMENSVVGSSFFSSSNLVSFSDQGQNLAGIFFQASLVPYLLFLYFLQFRANRLSDLGNFGFQFVLVFVMSTIPSGIISKGTYGLSLADTDWMHGGAELLLTIANVMIVRMQCNVQYTRNFLFTTNSQLPGVRKKLTAFPCFSSLCVYRTIVQRSIAHARSSA